MEEEENIRVDSWSYLNLPELVLGNAKYWRYENVMYSFFKERVIMILNRNKQCDLQLLNLFLLLIPNISMEFKKKKVFVIPKVVSIDSLAAAVDGISDVVSKMYKSVVIIIEIPTKLHFVALKVDLDKITGEKVNTYQQQQKLANMV